MEKRLRITLAARAVVAANLKFAGSGQEFSDASVAYDEIQGLPTPIEPLVLRVQARGGTAQERNLVSGDWFCDTDGSVPTRLPKPEWRQSRAAREWTTSRGWLEAWETCDIAEWMLHAATLADVDDSKLVLAASDCARRVLDLIPQADARPARAIKAAEAWALERNTSKKERLRYEARIAGVIASVAAQEYSPYVAADACLAASSAAMAAAVKDIATEVAAAAWRARLAEDGLRLGESPQSLDAGFIAPRSDWGGLVRTRIPTVTVLRAVVATTLRAVRPR